MRGVIKYTHFIVGDSQVGKTSFASELYQGNAVFNVSTTDQATEYYVYTQDTQECVIKIHEIRDYTFLLENAIEVDEDRDIVSFLYAIDDPESFEHVANLWIPLFRHFVSDRMKMILLGNKRDLRFNAEVVHELAERGLQPVSTEQGTELFHRDDIFSFFAEIISEVSQPFQYFIINE